MDLLGCTRHPYHAFLNHSSFLLSLSHSPELAQVAFVLGAAAMALLPKESK